MRPKGHSIHVFINKKKYDLDEPEQTGKALKELAGIPLGDVLFLQKKGNDLVIGNDTTVTLKNGDHLHSQPAADYGLDTDTIAAAGLEGERVELHSQPGGWTFLVIHNFPLPEGYTPRAVSVLIKLPPLFPEAAPDMFWVRPAARTRSGSMPKATTTEQLLGGPWQRYSWHLSSGAWKPGESTLRDYIRCIRGRFLRQD